MSTIFGRVALAERHQAGAPVLGLRANWRQFALLVVINGFVGAMVGLERSVLPSIASSEFGLASTSAALSFIVAFGVTKALTNYAAGWLIDRRGRRRTLILGWAFGLPVPLLLLFAPGWSWIVAANALLGINQGLAWSATVIMKIDLAGPDRRGLAMGLNECSGYVAVALAALASGYMATSVGLREGPAYLGIVVALTGLLLSLVLVRDTAAHVRLETAQASQRESRDAPRSGRGALFSFARRDAPPVSLSQAGFVNNLNDGVAWGIFPLLFLRSGLSLESTGVLAAIYPAVWGVGQIATGNLSDHWGRKPLIVAGMILQGMALIAMARWQEYRMWVAALIALGIGTALVYPTLLAAVADSATPRTRAAKVGVYRLWRDLGYAAGALVAGLLADALGQSVAIGLVGLLTIASGAVVAMRLSETWPRSGLGPAPGHEVAAPGTDAQRGTGTGCRG